MSDAIDAAGGDVEYSREYRPTFDEVFTALVTRHLEGKKNGASTGSGGGGMAMPTVRPR